MKSLKNEVINAISTLPDNVDIDEIMYQLYVIDQVEKGLEDVKNGNVTTIDELEKEMTKW